MGYMVATLAVGQTKTDTITVGPREELVGFDIDGNLTGTTFTFESAASRAGTFRPVEDDASAAVSITVAANTVAMITTAADVAALAPLKHFKIVSGSTQATNPSTIKVLTRQIA